MKRLLLVALFGLLGMSQIFAQKKYEFSLYDSLVNTNFKTIYPVDSVHYGQQIILKMNFVYTGTSTGTHDTFPGGTYNFNFYVNTKTDFPTAGISYTRPIVLPAMAYDGNITIYDTVTVTGAYYVRHNNIIIIWPTGNKAVGSGGNPNDSLDAKKFNANMDIWVYDHTAGIAPLASNNLFAIYPNPVKDQLNIQMQQATKGTVRLMDMTGKTVAIKTFDVDAHGMVSLPIADGKLVPDGMYFIAVETANDQQVSKIMINR